MARAGWASLALAAPPLLCFVEANKSKRRKEKRRWVRAQFLWHLVGGAVSALCVCLQQDGGWGRLLLLQQHETAPG